MSRYKIKDLIGIGWLEIGDGYRAKNSELASSGLPFARAANINDGFHFDGADCFPEANIFKVGNKTSRPNDVVFTSKGTVGRFAFVPPDLKPFVYSPQLCFWRSVDVDRIDPLFLFYWLQSAEAHDQFAYLKGQTDMADYVSLRDQKEMNITLPSIVEQRESGHALHLLSDRIDLLRQTNETLEAMARAIFKSWFVDFDPVRAKAEGREPEGMDADTAALFPSEFQDSELGSIPHTWFATTLGKEVKRNDGRIQTGPFGSQLHASDYKAEGVPVIMPQDIANRRASTIRIARVHELDAGRLSRHRVELGDIVYSRRGDVERHAHVGTREVGWLCGTGCLLVRMGPQWRHFEFVSLALDRPETRAWISQHAIGATMANLNTGILSAVPLIMPTENVLTAFTNVVEPLERRISANNAQVETLVALRDTLLPHLISGKLRVPEAEVLLAEAL